MLPVVLTDDEVTRLTEIAEVPGNTVTVDLATQRVTAEGFEASFDIDPFTKECLLNGLDHIALSLRHADEIATFEGQRPRYKPTVHL